MLFTVNTRNILWTDKKNYIYKYETCERVQHLVLVAPSLFKTKKLFSKPFRLNKRHFDDEPNIYYRIILTIEVDLLIGKRRINVELEENLLKMKY